MAEWPDARSMTAHHARTQDGKKMDENIAFAFTGKKSMTFRSTVTADGQPAGQISGALSR